MGNIDYSTDVLGKLGEDSKNSNLNNFGFTNNFGIRAMSVLEINLLGRVVKRDQSEEPSDGTLSAYFDKLGVINSLVKHYSNTEWYCYHFDIFLSQLDIDMNIGVNQNTVSEYCEKLQHNSLDFLEATINSSNETEWSEKPLYFYAVIFLYKQRFEKIFGFKYEDLNIPFDDIYNYSR